MATEIIDHKYHREAVANYVHNLLLVIWIVFKFNLVNLIHLTQGHTVVED